MTTPAVGNPGSVEGVADSSAPSDQCEGDLDALIRRWQERLRLWAGNGRLAEAARIALILPDHHRGLADFVDRLAAADFTALPAVVPLDWEDMEGSACA
ncbi:hypothetical protein NZK33_12225 [Cyanobium sp. FGCU-6]|nr:hypothetical protein [Cyanobium sp. FGCU6]